MQIEGLKLKHSGQQIQTELDLIDGAFAEYANAPIVCLGHIAKLASLHSSLLYDVPKNLEVLNVVFGIPATESIYTEVDEQINAGFRALECIQSDSTKEQQSKSTVIPFSPEWFADFIYIGCSALHGATVEYILWQMPFCTLCHLICANHRSNGGITARPYDGETVKNILNLLNKKD